MPAAPYIPNKEADLVNWANNFSTLITAAPSTYGLVSGDAVAIAAVVDAYDAAYALAIDPPTRTKPTVAAKDAARQAMLDVVRGYAIQIRNNAGVTNEDKADLGLTLPDPTPTPVPPPNTSPILSIPFATPLQLTLRFADQNTPDKRAKPPQITGLEVRAVASATVVADPAAIPFYGIATRQPFALNFDSSDAGKQAYVAGRWLNSKGQAGPWSNIATFTIPTAG
jgi:hypothetical protein